MLTLVVPCYNEAHRLPWAGLETWTQTHPRVRIILVDDGSTDATRTHIQELAARLPRQVTTLLLPRNLGKAEAVRCGLRLAHTTYIAYWDADVAAPLDAV